MTPADGTGTWRGIRWDEPPDLPGVPVAAQTVLRRLDTEAGVRQLGWIISALVAIALIIVLGRGGSTPKDPRVVTNEGPTATVTTRPRPAMPPGQP